MQVHHRPLGRKMIPQRAFVVAIAAFLYAFCPEVLVVDALNENRRIFTNENRRHFLTSILTTSSSLSTIAASSALLYPSPAFAARGAAELDLEYYARDLLGGNRREGSVAASQGPPLAPPRLIQEPLLSMLLTDDASCIPKTALISMLQSKSNNANSKMDAERLVQTGFVNYRSKAAKAFYTRAPFATECLDDQYYFDLSAYALWRTAGDLLPNPVDRDAFVRRVGRDLYQSILSKQLMPAAPSKEQSRYKISASTNEVRAMLNAFTKHGFIQSYRLSGSGDDSTSAAADDVNAFDELDDQALMDGATVDCLLSIMKPATLGAALQITGEQSRFAPDYVGPACAALLETFGLQCTWETYFVDNEYRPNPKDYFPNEQLIQFTISKSNAV
jgi:hypothetical protein